jgi:hypothetical protein
MTDDSTHIQAKPPPPNCALTPLGGLVGDWEMELSNAAFLPRPSDRVKGGPVLIEWVQDGAFLALRMGDNSPNSPMLSGTLAGMTRPPPIPCSIMTRGAFRGFMR